MQTEGQRILASVASLDSEKRPVTGDIRSALGALAAGFAAIGLGLDDGQRRSMKENMLDLIGALEAADRGEKPPAITTGLPTLDRVLGGGIRMGDMTVLGARTSVGKSALACWITKSGCADGKSVLYASREMQARQITARLLSAEAEVGVIIHEGIKDLSSADKKSIIGAQARMKDWKLTIRDDLRSISDIRAEASVLKPDMIVVDHIGIFDSGLGPKASTYDRATANSHACRDLAFDTGAAVLALAQVNRAGAGEDKPRLEHLKSTGALEEDARAVILLHRLEELSSSVQMLELDLAKNSYGSPRILKLKFDAARCTFTEEHDLL